MACYQIDHLKFTYPHRERRALDDLSLTVEQGEYVAICGKSGCGKSTLLRHLKTVLAPHGQLEGSIYFYGQPLEEVDRRTQTAQIGFVLQDPDNQIVTDKVWHELAFGLESLGANDSTIRRRVAEMASYFGIQTWFMKDVAELSGGQKQLLNLASIMAIQPSVLLLDEPTSQLDPIAASDFLNTIRKINLELGTTVIITEHRLEDVIPAADRVVIMDQGRITMEGAPADVGRELKNRNDDMFVAMPSPMQIYANIDNDLDCPLTVREGRSWLSKLLQGHKISYRSVPDKASLDTSDPVLCLHDVWFRYEREGNDVLRDVNLSIPRGQLFCIVGGNGTGKSTMLKALSRQIRPYRGKITLDGQDISKMKHDELYQRGLAMLPQNPQSLFVMDDLRSDLMEVFDHSTPKEERNARVDEIMQLVEITELATSHPYDLSGGEQQRAALAKVLLLEPRVLLLDEPTKGIDNFFKIKLATILKKLKQKGVTVVMVSHDVEFCARHGDSCSLFFNGSVVSTETPNKFFANNSFYTTAANRMSRHMFINAINSEDVLALCKQNLGL